MELMDEWESNTSRRICWGSAGRYWVAGQLQERGAYLQEEGAFQMDGAFERAEQRELRGREQRELREQNRES